MSLDHVSGCARTRKALTRTAIAVLAASVLATAAAPARAEDKKPAPHGTRTIAGETKDYLVVVLTDAIVVNYSPGGAPTPLVVQGRLHVVVETSFDAAGAVVERRLHANLLDSSATTTDGALRFAATGSEKAARSGEGCGPEETCAPEVWSLAFDLDGPGGGPQAMGHVHDAFTLRVATRYGADGALAGIAVVAQDGPPILG